MSNSDDSITNPASAATTGAPQPARLWRRLVAAAYDSLLLTAVFLIVTAAIVLTQRSGIPAGSPGFRGLLAGTGWLYFAWCWVHGGQTVGMRAWKIRVVSAGNPRRTASWPAATLRFAAALLPAAPLGLASAGVRPALAAGLAAACFAAGYGAAALRTDRACWHDVISGTRLVRIAG